MKGYFIWRLTMVIRTLGLILHYTRESLIIVSAVIVIAGS